jgi:hypothetical protein
MEVTAMPQMDPRVFLAVAMSGDSENPGVPAVVWINAAEGNAKYTRIDEVNPIELRAGLRQMHGEEKDSFLFVNQNGPRVHVFKHSKEYAMQSLSAALPTPRP